LGAIIPVRGVKDVNGVLFPRFTGAYAESASSVPLGQGDVRRPISPFIGPGSSGKNFFSDDVTVLGNSALAFPYRGVYRVRFQIAYRNLLLSETPGLTLSFIALNGGVGTLFSIVVEQIENNGLIKFDQELICDAIERPLVAIIGEGEVVIPVSRSPLASPETFLEVSYVGAI